MPPNFKAVKKLREYVIPVKGLNVGNHRFQIEINDSFFKLMEFPEINKGNILLQLTIEKESNLMIFDFFFLGTVQLQCDRCLENYNQKIEGKYRLIFKNSDHYEEVSDEIINIPAEKSRIDISQYVFEFINLMTPIKKVHPDDKNGNSTCNPVMLKKLEEYEVKKTDTRWDALKDIKFD